VLRRHAAAVRASAPRGPATWGGRSVAPSPVLAGGCP
jgi:hypothetical protein